MTSSPTELRPSSQSRRISLYGWLYLLAGIFMILLGAVSEDWGVIIGGSVNSLTGWAILTGLRASLPLVWSANIGSGFGVLFRGLIPIDALLWIGSLVLAIWYTRVRKSRLRPEEGLSQKEGGTEPLDSRRGSHLLLNSISQDEAKLSDSGRRQRSTSMPLAPMLQPNAISIAVVAVGLFCFAWLVWPTAYRYDTFPSGSKNLPLRINRISGEAEVLTIQGWQKMEKVETQAASSPKADKDCQYPPGTFLRRAAEAAGKCK